MGWGVGWEGGGILFVRWHREYSWGCGAAFVPYISHPLPLPLLLRLSNADWFLCLFCTSLPSETAARVWDALLHEGTKV